MQTATFLNVRTENKDFILPDSWAGKDVRWDLQVEQAGDDCWFYDLDVTLLEKDGTALYQGRKLLDPDEDFEVDHTLLQSYLAEKAADWLDQLTYDLDTDSL